MPSIELESEVAAYMQSRGIGGTDDPHIYTIFRAATDIEQGETCYIVSRDEVANKPFLNSTKWQDAPHDVKRGGLIAFQGGIARTPMSNSADEYLKWLGDPRNHMFDECSRPIDDAQRGAMGYVTSDGTLTTAPVNPKIMGKVIPKNGD